MAKTYSVTMPDGSIKKVLEISRKGSTMPYEITGQGNERKIIVQGQALDYPEAVEREKSRDPKSKGGQEYVDTVDRMGATVELIDSDMFDGPEAFNKKFEARNMPYFSMNPDKEFGISERGIETPLEGRIPIGWGRAFDTMIRGIGDAHSGIIEGMMTDGWKKNPNKQQIAAMARNKAKEGVQEEESRMMAPFQSEQGFLESIVAETPPFLATGIAGTKPAELLAKGAGKMLTRLPFAANTPIQFLTGTNPWTTRAEKVRRKQAETPMESYYNKGYGERAGGALVLGAAEGAIDPRADIIESTISSFLGQQAGRLKGKMLNKETDRNLPSDRAILDWGQEKVGYVPTPGLNKGNKEWQGSEAGYRADKDTSPIFQAFDQANDTRINKHLMETLGIKDVSGDGSTFTKDTLNNHLDTMGKEFDVLEASSNVDMNLEDIAAIERLYSTIPKTEAGKKNVSDLKAIINDIRAQSGGSAGSSTGPRPMLSFDGKQYKDIRASINEAKKNAQAEGQRDQANRIDDIITMLDNSMESTLVRNKGEMIGPAWRDLRERYTLGKTLIDDAIDPDGRVSLKKYANSIHQNGARMATGSGSDRINNINDLIGLSTLDKHQRGTLMSGSDINDTSEKSGLAKAMLSPWTSAVSYGKESLIKNYLKGGEGGWKQNGILGLPTDTRMIEGNTRAMQQGSDDYTQIGQGAINIATDPIGSGITLAKYLSGLAKDKWNDNEKEEYYNK